MPASFRPVWVWPLLAVPPAAAALLLIAEPAVHLALLLSGLAALPLIRTSVERRRVVDIPRSDVSSALQLGWLVGGPGRALDVAMARLLSIGALQWWYDTSREVWSFRRVAEVQPPAELALLHRLCAGGAQAWQLQVLAARALGPAHWALVERGWWIDRWTSRWARFWSSVPLTLVLLVSLVRLPAAFALGFGPGLLALQLLALLALVGNALYAPERTRRGARALAVAQRPQTSDPLEVLAWRVARDGPDVLTGTAAERWSQIRASGADRRP